MKRNSRNEVWWIVFSLSVVAVLGIIVGHSRRHVTSGADAAKPVVATADAHRRPDPPAQVNARTIPNIAPAELTYLNGKEFVDALPAMETLARSGNLDAARVLYQRLRSCVDFDNSSDDEIRGRENADYQQQLEIVKRIRAEHHDRPENPMFNENSLRQAHETALKAAFDQRDLCAALTPQQIEKRLDWALFALERHDRQTILDATMPGSIGVNGIERVRNAEKLTEIAEIERNGLNDLIAAGDLAALERAVYAYGSDSNGLLQHDSELAYMYAYALSLAGNSGNEKQQRAIIEMMESLARGQPLDPPLTVLQINAATVQGLALFQSCCANGPPK